MAATEFEVKSDELPEKVESTFIGNIDNTQWHFYQSKTDGYLTVGVVCNKDMYSNLWTCTATVKISLCSSKDPKPIKEMEKRMKFSDVDDEKKLSFQYFFKITETTKKMWEESEKPMDLVFKISIEIHSTTGYQPKDGSQYKFDLPEENITDVVLLVEGKQVHFNKQALAMHSKKFHKLFYGNTEELNRKEFKLQEDVKYEQFLDLLRQISPPIASFQKDNISHILKLAAHFEMWHVIFRAEQYLIDNDLFSNFEKLKFAGDYKMRTLQKEVVEDLEEDDILEIKKDERFKELHPEIVCYLFEILTNILIERRRPRRIRPFCCG